MAETIVKDVVIWSKHIYGDDVVTRLATMKGGETIELLVDGYRGPWLKMADGSDGRPTSGIRPIGSTFAFWKELYALRRGEIVELAIVSDANPSASVAPREISFADRRSAFEKLRSLMHAGQSSEGRTLSRDEMHER